MMKFGNVLKSTNATQIMRIKYNYDCYKNKQVVFLYDKETFYFRYAYSVKNAVRYR